MDAQQALELIGAIGGILASIVTILAFFAPAQWPLKRKLIAVGGTSAGVFLIGLLLVTLLPPAALTNSTASRPTATLPAGTTPQSTLPPGFTPQGTPTAGNPTSTPRVLPTATATSSTRPPTYPQLAQHYQGTITDAASQLQGDLTLTAIVQSQDMFTGQMYRTPFSGNGPFSGRVGTDKSIRFTIQVADDGSGPIDFMGFVNPDGSLSGTYFDHTYNSTGTWKVHPVG